MGQARAPKPRMQGVSRKETTVRWTVVPANGGTGTVRPGLFAQQDAQRKVAPSGVSFFLVAFSWTSKKKLHAVGQPPTSTRRPKGGSTYVVEGSARKARAT